MANIIFPVLAAVAGFAGTMYAVGGIGSKPNPSRKRKHVGADYWLRRIGDHWMIELADEHLGKHVVRRYNAYVVDPKHAAYDRMPLEYAHDGKFISQEAPGLVARGVYGSESWDYKRVYQHGHERGGYVRRRKAS